MVDRPPVTALAFFFDDIRTEVGNKLTLIGQYGPQMFITDPNFPVDRLAVLLHIRWPSGHHLSNAAVRMDLPGQPSQQYQNVPMEIPKSEPSASPFSCNIMQVVVQIRFPGLRVGDNIDVWLRIDGHEFPAGRLNIIAPTSQYVPVA